MKTIKLSEFKVNPEAAFKYSREIDDVEVLDDETGELRMSLLYMQRPYTLELKNAEMKYFELQSFITYSSSMMEDEKEKASSLLKEMWSYIENAKS